MPFAMTEILWMALSGVPLWGGNPKRHDIGGIIRSIRRYGFREPLVFDATLGAVVSGNGRVKALRMMKEWGNICPRGIREEDGEWYVPVVIGNDARRRSEAEAYALDSNMLMVSGGETGLEDLVRLYDDRRLLDVLKGMADGGDFGIIFGPEEVERLLRQEQRVLEQSKMQEARARGRKGATGKMQEAGGKMQGAGGKRQEAGGKMQGAGGKMQEAGDEMEENGSGLPLGSKLSGVDETLQAYDEDDGEFLSGPWYISLVFQDLALYLRFKSLFSIGEDDLLSGKELLFYLGEDVGFEEPLEARG